MNFLKRPRILLLSAFFIALLVVIVARLQSNCPARGIAISPGVLARLQLKNRTTPPERADFDPRITLATLLQPGDDRARWSPSRGAAIEGYVVAVYEGSLEPANCFSPTWRDTHIDVALRPDAAKRERFILEVTPRVRDWAARRGWDWSTPALTRELVGRWCYFEGWLFFDSAHDGESENTAPGRARNWRATAWEIHPVTYLRVVR
ncbi:MAG TPA: hypothetical protein VFD58_32780 [Blastocatellia bacterium]|nr:hypothetical protein [Blastocatellia bacterium]